VGEARLEETPGGLVPATPGWFVVNVADAAWRTRERFGSACRFEGPDAPFPSFGINLRVLHPGQPNALYHRESNQEAVLVLSGECLLIVDEQERTLRAWDFVNLPAGTDHIVIGAGDGPCALLMAGARSEDEELLYPRSEVALRHGAGAEATTPDPALAYAGTGPVTFGPPDVPGLPWGPPAA
jgi:uncharacterized cupin superfamily protein